MAHVQSQSVSSKNSLLCKFTYFIYAQSDSITGFDFMQESIGVDVCSEFGWRRSEA